MSRSARSMSGLSLHAREVGLDGEQRIDETLALPGAQAGEGVAHQLRRDLAQRAHRRLDRVGEMNAPGAPIAGVVLAPHPSLSLEPVKQPPEGRPFDLEDLGELRLVEARI